MIRSTLDLPCLYITEVTNRRLPFFQKDYIKELVCAALKRSARLRRLCSFGLCSDAGPPSPDN